MFIKLHYATFESNPPRHWKGESFFVNPRYIRKIDRAFIVNPYVNHDTAEISIDGELHTKVVFESIGEVMELIAAAEKRNA